MARLDRLGPAKEVAQLASVLGREFSYEMMSALATTSESVLADALNALEGAELLYRWRLLWGWVTFTLSCGIGTVANVGVASFIFNWRQVAWMPAALAGILISSVWNYAVSAIFTWNAPRQA